MEITLRFEVAEGSRVGEARRAAAKLARELGFSAADTERVALVVTELGTNLAKHAGGGELLVVSGRRQTPPAVEIVSLDRGPGTDDFGEWLRDGYSTSGSPGTGLGAVRRLSDAMDVYSARGVGTAILARVVRREPTAAADVQRPRFEAGGISIPLRGEEVSGDAWAVRLGRTRAVLVLSDGLGHGGDALLASAEAVRVFHEGDGLGPGDLLARMAAEMRHTRGAAIAVASLEPDTASLRFAGIGNISGTVISSEATNGLVSYNGIVGHQSTKIRELTYTFASAALVILHSDGLKSRWKLDDYPGLRHRDPTLIAAVLYRDFARGTDDVGIVVAREVCASDAAASTGTRAQADTAAPDSPAATEIANPVDAREPRR